MGAFDYKPVVRTIYGAPMFFTSSRNFIIPQDGIYRIDALGGGASGGAVTHGSFGVATVASGGGGGGYSMKEVFLRAGTLLVITVGAAGGFVQAYSGTSGAGAFANGTDGGNTSVVGAGVSIFAFGGKKGTANWSVTSLLSGGLGGYAAGGDINFKGGDGGDATNTSTTGPSGVAGGGGCAGHPYGNGGKGNSFSGAGSYLYGDGVGVSGGINGFSLDNLSNTNNGGQPQSAPWTTDISLLVASQNLPLLYLNGKTSFTVAVVSGPGAATGSGVIGGYSGIFAGSSSRCGDSYTAAITAGQATYGGGGGGACGTNGTAGSTVANPVNSGGGGKGLVVIERVG